MFSKKLILLTVLIGFSIFNYVNSEAVSDKGKGDKGNADKPLVLAGTTWTIVNKTIDSEYFGTTGQVTFSNDSLTIDSGRFASAGLVAASENTSFCLIPLNPISYEVIGDSLIYVTWTGQARTDSSTYQQEATITIDSRDGKRLILAGVGGCGGTTPRISILTRVP